MSLLSKLPQSSASDDEKRSYAQEITAKFLQFQTNIKLLSFLDKNLPDTVTTKLSSCEDLLTDYIGTLSDSKKNKVTLRADLQDAVWKLFMEALESIRDKHISEHK